MKIFVYCILSMMVGAAPVWAFRDGRGAACASRSDCSSITDVCRGYVDGKRYCVAHSEQCAWPGTIGVRMGTRSSLSGRTYVCDEIRGWISADSVIAPEKRGVLSTTANDQTKVSVRDSEATRQPAGCPYPCEIRQTTPNAERTSLPTTSMPEVVIRATADAWIRVYDQYGAVLLSQVLKQGQSWLVPRRSNLLLTTGNAGATQLVVGNVVVPYLGATNQVKRDISLDPGLLVAGRGG